MKQYIKYLSGSKPGWVVIVSYGTFCAVALVTLVTGIINFDVANRTANIMLAMLWAWIGMPAIVTAILTDQWYDLYIKYLESKH